MPFPDSSRVIFDRNPIAQVICQLKFPPILEISSSTPAELQKKIRGNYPLFEQDFTLGLPKEVAELISKIPGAGQAESVVYRFLTESRARVVALTKDFIALTETEYTEWKDFRARLAEAQVALEETYRPSFYSRAGLRYINMIDLADLGLVGAKWKDLLNPSFVGILGSAEVAAQVTNIGTQAVIDLSQDIPDAKATLRFGMRADEKGQESFFIDSDFYVEGHIEGHDVGQILDRFNRLDGNLFRWAVGGTGPLWTALQPRSAPA